jgi:hypothetical protein
LAPPVGSQPLPGRARGPLSVPYRLSTPTYRLQAKTNSKTCSHMLPRATAAPELAPLLREGSGAATCPEALGPTSSSRRGLALPHVLRHQTPPHHPRVARRCHTFLSTGPRRADKAGSGVDTRPSAPDHVLAHRGGLQCLRMSHGTPRSMGRRDKKRLSCNGMQQGSRVFKIRQRVIEAPARCVGIRRYHDLQTMQIGATAPRYSAPPRS